MGGAGRARAGATRRWRRSARSSRQLGPAPHHPRASASPASARRSSPSIGAARRCAPGCIYRDNRAVAEADAFRERFGAERLHSLTGHVPAAFHVAAKILWIRAHEPEVFKATRLFLEPTEYLALSADRRGGHRLDDGCGERAARPPQAAWSPELIDALGLDLQQLPVPHPSWTIIGELRPALVRRFGLARTIPVVAGAGDSIACAFGAGVASPGPASEMAGSSTCINTVVSEPTRDLAITHYPSAVGPTGYVTEVGINTAGEAVDWVAALMYGGRSGRPRSEDFETLDREAAEVAPGADGLLFIPVLGDGERDDPMLRGARSGCRSAMTAGRGHARRSRVSRSVSAHTWRHSVAPAHR